MRPIRWRFLCLLAWLAVSGLRLYGQAAPSLSVGFYDWGGVYQASIRQGVDAIATLGSHIARLAISPRMDIDYHMGSVCIPGFTLAGALQTPEVKPAIDNPAISVFILTAYDGVTFGDCVTHKYLVPAFYTDAAEAAIVQEYSDLTLYLYQTYQHTNKRFIISNWESDNDIYCGQAWLYATDKTFRSSCNNSYPQSYGNQSPDDSIVGLKLWFQARAKGIDDGRNRALAAGIGAMKVYLAPEISVTRCLHDAGIKSALYDVIPGVKFDYISYSSYQSVNMPDPRSALLQDLQTIQDVAGTNAILIGEIMTTSPGMDPNVFLQSLRGAMDAALAWGVPYVIYWNLYASSDLACGLYDTSGQMTAVGKFFETYLPGTRTCVQPGGSDLHRLIH